jgi:hypothetical protein
MGPAGAMRMQQLANATDAEIDRANRAWARGRAEMRRYVDFRVPPKEVDVNIDPAIAAINALEERLRGIKDEDVFVNVHHSTTYTERKIQGPAVGGAVANIAVMLAGKVPVNLNFTAGREGRVTRIAGQGETVEQGDELYRVDERPVILLYGVVPMFRDLGPGDSGADVAQLEANLAELGYGGFTVDDQYTSFTATAVRAWQEDAGAEPTGTIARGDVVFAPQGGRVDALRTGVGDRAAPGTAVLDLTGTDQVVSLEVDVDDRDRFAVGAEVTVLLPGGDEVAGTVGATAIVEVRSDNGDSASVLQVEVALAEPVPDEFVGTAVDVVVAVDERTDVLLVPVNALLALAEGGYGLEVVADDGATSVVAVETGLFADGQVEVRSDDIAEGTVVGVAGR